MEDLVKYGDLNKEPKHISTRFFVGAVVWSSFAIFLTLLIWFNPIQGGIAITIFVHLCSGLIALACVSEQKKQSAKDNDKVRYRAKGAFYEFLNGPFKFQAKKVLVDWRKRNVWHANQAILLRGYAFILMDLAEIYGISLEKLNARIYLTIVEIENVAFGNVKYSPPSLKIVIEEDMCVSVTVGKTTTIISREKNKNLAEDYRSAALNTNEPAVDNGSR